MYKRNEKQNLLYLQSAVINCLNRDVWDLNDDREFRSWHDEYVTRCDARRACLNRD